MEIRTKPSVRLRPPSFLTGPKWVADDFATRRRFALPAPGVLLLVTCMRPQQRDQAVSGVANRLHLSGASVNSVADVLLTNGLLAPGSDGATQWFEEVRQEWAKWGWAEAAEYHLATYDYQFLGADEEGRRRTHERMLRYSEQEPDCDRSKHYPDALAYEPLPKPDASMVPTPLPEAWDGSVPSRPLDGPTLGAVVAITVGKIGFMSPRWDGAPMMRRTSPSGGSRHPSEAYVAVVDVASLRPGWYHIASDPPELALLREGDVNHGDLESLFPTTYVRASFPVKAVVVLTSVFERNMYRYREPRTFRTIHMDAGHLLATLEASARALGVKVFAQYSVNERAMEEKLGLHMLEEGCQLSIALG